MTIERLAPQVDQAYAALAKAEGAERAASVEVDRIRELHAVGRVPRGDLLKAQMALSKRQNEQADAAAAVRLLDREAEAAHAAAVAASQRERAERSAVLRVEQATLEARLGSFLASIETGYDELERDIAAWNAEAVGVRLAAFRGLSDFGAWGRVEDGLTVLKRFFPPPKQPTGTTNEREI